MAMTRAWSRTGAWRGRGTGGRGAGRRGKTDLVILSNMLRGSRMKVGRVTLLRSAPGRSWEMIWVRTFWRWSQWRCEAMRRGDGAEAHGDERLTIALVGLNNKGVVILMVFGIGGACAGWCGGEPRRQHLGQAEFARFWRLRFWSSRAMFL
jgi:hypothetical protein